VRKNTESFFFFGTYSSLKMLPLSKSRSCCHVWVYVCAHVCGSMCVCVWVYVCMCVRVRVRVCGVCVSACQCVCMVL